MGMVAHPPVRQGYHGRVGVALAIYVIGVIVGLLLTDARPLARVAIAALWPLGAVAFVVVIAILLVTAMVVFPVFGAAVVAVAALSWFLLFGSRKPEAGSPRAASRRILGPEIPAR